MKTKKAAFKDNLLLFLFGLDWGCMLIITQPSCQSDNMFLHFKALREVRRAAAAAAADAVHYGDAGKCIPVLVLGRTALRAILRVVADHAAFIHFIAAPCPVYRQLSSFGQQRILVHIRSAHVIQVIGERGAQPDFQPKRNTVRKKIFEAHTERNGDLVKRILVPSFRILRQPLPFRAQPAKRDAVAQRIFRGGIKTEKRHAAEYVRRKTFVVDIEDIQFGADMAFPEVCAETEIALLQCNAGIGLVVRRGHAPCKTRAQSQEAVDVPFHLQPEHGPRVAEIHAFFGKVAAVITDTGNAADVPVLGFTNKGSSE